MNARPPSPGAGPDGGADARLAGAPNFRPVAALAAADGRRLRARRLFRSDALHRLTDADLDAIGALRIGAILDLRRDDERAAMPSRWPGAARCETLTFDARPDLQAVRAGGWRAAADAPDFDGATAHAWMVETYARMPAALAPAVREAAVRLAGRADAGASGAILVHCTAGKDRTGFVVAMLLTALGVPREAIVDDYLESARRRPPPELAQALVAFAGLRPTPRLLAAVEAIADVRTDYLDAALDTAQADHGSLAAYLRACGVDDRLEAALRDALLD